MGIRRRPRRVTATTGLVLLAALVVLAVAAGLVIEGASVADRRRDVGVEAVKAGLQLLVLAAAGLGITGMVTWAARKADERRRVNDEALELLREVIGNYNRMKACRRILRAMGIDKLQPADRLSAEQAKEFERQMRALSKVQLAFERVGREIGVRLDEHRDSMQLPLKGPQADLACMEKYVYGVVEDWEKHEAAVRASGYDGMEIAELKSLQGFLLASKDDPEKTFRKSTSRPLHRLEDYFRDKLIVSLAPKDDSRG